MKNIEIELGDRVQCKITKFKGVVTCVSKWLNGCNRIAVQSEKLDDRGNVVESHWFDEPQLEIKKKAVVSPFNEEKKSRKKEPGGPMPSIPPQRNGG